LLTARVDIQATGYPNGGARQAFFMSVLGDLAAVPGVRSVGATSHLPLADPGNTWGTRPSDRPGAAARDLEHTHLRRASPGYFAAMQMPLVSRRDIAATDRDGAAMVAVVSESLARRLYPTSNPLGRTVVLVDDLSNPPKDVPYEIIGIARSARLASPREEADPALIEAFDAGTYVGAATALALVAAAACLAPALRATRVDPALVLRGE
jgi:putative ABC transport system permease protein